MKSFILFHLIPQGLITLWWRLIRSSVSFTQDGDTNFSILLPPRGSQRENWNFLFHRDIAMIKIIPASLHDKDAQKIAWKSIHTTLIYISVRMLPTKAAH